MSTGKADLYTRITSRIVAALEQGVRPWFDALNVPSGPAYQKRVSFGIGTVPSEAKKSSPPPLHSYAELPRAG